MERSFEPPAQFEQVRTRARGATTLYSLQLYSISTVYNLYNTPLVLACMRDLDEGHESLHES